MFIWRCCCVLFVKCDRNHRYLLVLTHSFPTRRSSDLDWETLPYDSFSPHQDLISERLRTLHALMQESVDILTVPVTTALYRLAPPEFLAAYTFSFRQRSEEHTSELQSLMRTSYAVFCLKKKNIQTSTRTDHTRQ